MGNSDHGTTYTYTASRVRIQHRETDNEIQIRQSYTNPNLVELALQETRTTQDWRADLVICSPPLSPYGFPTVGSCVEVGSGIFTIPKYGDRSHWMVRLALLRGRVEQGNVKRFRGRLVFKAHRLLYHSTLGLIVIKRERAWRSRAGQRRAPIFLPYLTQCIH